MKNKTDNEIFYNAGRVDALAVVIALLFTIAIHIAIFASIPTSFKVYKAADKIEELHIEIMPPKIDRRVPQFVEANPFGNQLEPEEGAAESFMTQRAAEELPDPDSKSRRPSTEGDTPDSQKIVQGTSSAEDSISPNAPFETLERPLEQQAHPTEMPSEPSAAAANAATQRQQQAPANAPQEAEQSEGEPESGAALTAAQEVSEGDEHAGDAKESAAENAGESARTQNDEAFLRINERHARADANAAATQGEDAAKKSAAPKPQAAEKAKPAKSAPKPQEQPEQPQQKPEDLANDPNLPAPKSRPSLSMKIPAGPLAENKSRTSERGVVSVDSRFSEFGAYQQRMIEAISRQWNLLASKYDLGTAVGTQVIIEYTLNPQGDLVKLQILYSNSTNAGTGLCEQSILTTAPYGEWTEEMINSLGTQDQGVRITFYYR